MVAFGEYEEARLGSWMLFTTNFTRKQIGFVTKRSVVEKGAFPLELVSIVRLVFVTLSGETEANPKIADLVESVCVLTVVKAIEKYRRKRSSKRNHIE